MSSSDDRLCRTVPVLPDEEESDEKNEERTEKEDADADDGGDPGMITRHIYLKNPDKLSRDVILRRIRHRRRVNKVKNAVRSLFSPAKGTGSTDETSTFQPQRSIDDAFSAP